MTKQKKSPIATASAGDAVRVRDASTREELTHVISADAERGKVARYAVEDGNLVREGDALKVVAEDRAIIIEPVEPIAIDPVDVSEVTAGREAQG